MSAYPITTYRYDPSTKTFTTKTVDRKLGLNEVLIKTSHSGICYTDVHAKEKCCGLGHEGVGIIAAVGDGVKRKRIGDRVGWGWLRSSCGACPSCIEGYRQYCKEARGFAFYDLEQGAFGDYHIIDADFAYHIPESISSVNAGPFMCAGASVYEALDAAGAKPSDRVGVVGIGGLGHMAVLFAKAMGCAVTAITGKYSPEKRALVKELGADEYRSLEDIEKAEMLGSDDSNTSSDKPWADHSGINVLLITANETPDFDRILPLLARRASIILMSIQQQPLPIPYMPFILPGHKLIASTEASERSHIDMLEFAARHRIQPLVEIFPMTEKGVKEAFDKLESGQMRFRGVLEVPQ